VKILIAAASFASNISGLQRHALNVVRCLLPESEIEAVHLVIAPWQRNFVQAQSFRQDPRLMVHVAEMERGSLSRNHWYYRKLPELAAQLRADLVHLSYPMPVNSAAFSCPTMVTLHDLYPYEIPMNFGFPKFIFNRIVLQQCLRNVQAIATVSDITLLRLKQYAPLAVWQKAIRIYNCVEAEPVCDVKPPNLGWKDKPFLLCVAQHRRNKNIPLLIRTFARMLRSGQVADDMKLVIVGIAGPETRMIHWLVANLGVGRNVGFLEGVSEVELQWCYKRCDAVVSPSITEGFGLPVAEALLTGGRIICSDIPAFREVGDEHCRFVALGNDAEKRLAAEIATALDEPKSPPRCLPQFSAPVLAKQYVSLYRRLITSGIPLEKASVTASINVAASERQPL
jgi:glycosyltransferase involved in cell wall biosynthesis